jgi:hypothetical protein
LSRKSKSDSILRALHTGGECQQGIRIPIDERQGRNLFGGGGLPDSCVGGIHRRYTPFDRNRAGRFSKLQMRIHPRRLSNLQRDPGLPEGSEPGIRHLQFVASRRQKVDAILAPVAGLYRPGQAGFRVLRSYLCAHDYRTLCVVNGAENTTGCLLCPQNGANEPGTRKRQEKCKRECLTYH